MSGSFKINPSSIGKVAAMTREELLELHIRKDRYTDFLHEKICDLNNQLYSTRKYRHQNISMIQNQEDMIDYLKLKLFKLTGSITG